MLKLSAKEMNLQERDDAEEILLSECSAVF